MFDAARWPEAAGEGIFVPRWSAAPPRFAPWGAGANAGGETPAADSGPVEIGLWDAGYAAGRAEALAEADRAAGDTARLIAALDRLQPMPPAALADALAAEVRALLRTLVGSATIDEALLIARCAELAEMAGDGGQAVLHAHPDDLAILDGAAGDLALCSDTALPRGELRLVEGHGDMAAGPLTMLGRLAAEAGDPPC